MRGRRLKYQPQCRKYYTTSVQKETQPEGNKFKALHMIQEEEENEPSTTHTFSRAPVDSVFAHEEIKKEVCENDLRMSMGAQLLEKMQMN